MRAKVTLGAGIGMFDADRNQSAKLIDSLTGRDDVLDAYVFVPAERLGELASVASSARARVLSIGGTRLRYRRGGVHGIYLDTEFNEEDY